MCVQVSDKPLLPSHLSCTVRHNVRMEGQKTPHLLRVEHKQVDIHIAQTERQMKIQIR